jgi:hypothetical protein
VTGIALAAERRRELEELTAANGGTITPAQVVEYAADPSTALHGLFTWDDSEAARRYREQQAAQYLRVVLRVVPREGGEPLVTRAFVSLSADRGTGVYRPVVNVLSDTEQRAQLVRDAMAELAAFRRKYQNIAELADLFAAMEQAAPQRAAA